MYLSMLLILSFAFALFCCAIGEEFPFSIGPLRIFCPEPKDVWRPVGTQCFRMSAPVENETSQMDWAEAEAFCGLPMNSASTVLHLDSWLLYRDLSRAFRWESQPGNEFWTGWFVDVKAKGQLPDRIQRLVSTLLTQNGSTYNPAWASLEPRVANAAIAPGRWCISWDAALIDETNFGWRLRNCSDRLPTICQTFPCFLDSTGSAQFRCRDNSACISRKALCDGVNDCADGDDELEERCTDKCTGTGAGETTVKLIGATSGNIHSAGWHSPNGPPDCASRQQWWVLRQPQGARIRLNFLSLKLGPSDRIWLSDEDTGQSVQLALTNEDTSFATLSAANNLKIVYQRGNEGTGGGGASRGFHLQFSVDDAAVCVRTFESWNGSFSVPRRIPDTGRYRTPARCRWTIENRDRGPISVKFRSPPRPRLAGPDWLSLSEGPLLWANFSASAIPSAVLSSGTARLQLDFLAVNGSTGAIGFGAEFQRSCLDQIVDFGTSGTIHVSLVGRPEDPLHCSLIVRIPNCPDCPFTVFVDQLEAEGEDTVTLTSEDGRGISIDTAKNQSASPPLRFRSASPAIRIDIRQKSTHLRALISYSIDCPPPPPPIQRQDGPFAFRSFVEVPCSKNTKKGRWVCARDARWTLIGCEEQGPFGIALAQNGAKEVCAVPAIQNGRVVELDRAEGLLRFSCNFGHAPSEPAESHCAPNGQWEPTPNCSEVLCADPPSRVEPVPPQYAPRHMYVEAQLQSRTMGNRVGSWAVYGCPNGTRARGVAQAAECTSQGDWTHVDLACLKLGCHPLTVQLGKFARFWTPIDELAQIDCVEGANLTANSSVLPRCRVDGKGEAHWEGVPEEGLKCQFVDRCGSFGDEDPCGEHGQCVSSAGANHTCRCESGFRFDAQRPRGIQCQEVDECAEGTALCSGGECRPAANASASYTCTCPGDSLLYDDQNRQITRLLVPSARWLRSNHSCIRSRCPPISQSNGSLFLHFSSALLLANSTVSVFCRLDEQSVPIGPEAQFGCGGDGQWQGQLPETGKCTKTAYSCAVPLLPNRATLFRHVGGGTKREFAIGDSVVFECLQWRAQGQNGNGTDYVMAGPDRAVCLPGGRWSSGPPRCILPQCSAISLGVRPSDGLNVTRVPPQDGPPTGEPFPVGTKVEMSCGRGEQNWTMVCTRRGASQPPMWSMDELPTCGAPEGNCSLALEDALLVPSRNPVPVGAEVHFRCAQPNYELSDSRPRKCEKGAHNKRVGRQIWRRTRSREADSVEVLFDSDGQRRGWKSSWQWTREQGGTSWRYNPTLAGKNFLVSPSIRVESGVALEVSVRVAPDPCAECLLWLSHFSAQGSVEELPPIEEFVPKGGVLFPQSGSVQIVPEHGRLWLQISADAQTPAMSVHRISVTRNLPCPDGNCTAAEQHSEALMCHSCTSESASSACIFSASRAQSQKCATGQICVLRAMANGTGAVPFRVDRGCAHRSADCGILSANVSVRESCRTSLDGVETCTACCSDSFCNGGLPSHLLGGEPTAALAPSEFTLDAAPPRCLDRQPMQVHCAQRLSIRRASDGGPEATLVPWPRVLDNDPHFSLLALGMPSLSPNVPYAFRGDESKIVWFAEDRHGVTETCETILEFEHGTRLKLLAESAKAPSSAGVECPSEAHIHWADTSQLSTATWPPLAPADYPPLRFSGSSATRLTGLSFDPPAGALLPLELPQLVTVRANGRKSCAFWYQIKATDCPLGALGRDVQRQFECSRSSDGLVNCQRRLACAPGSREFPPGLVELRCRMGPEGQGEWSYVNRQGERLPLREGPMCREEASSSVTLSVELSPSRPPGVDCMRQLARRMRSQLTGFLVRNCPDVHWSVDSHSVQSISVVQNFSTTEHGRQVLFCIQRVTSRLSAALSPRPGPGSSEHECPSGHLGVRQIAYHLHCAKGWGSNELLRCEICPRGHFVFNDSCTACPQGSFAPSAGTPDGCLPCPGGTSTPRPGATSQAHCLPICPLGFHSSTGLAPCDACPKGGPSASDQPASCGPAQTSSAAEPELDCLLDGCSARGVCEKDKCKCELGFGGAQCAFPVDLCGAEFCLNQGRCLFDARGGSKCICPNDFYGVRCENSHEGGETILSGSERKAEAIIKDCAQTGATNRCPNGRCLGGSCECNDGFRSDLSDSQKCLLSGPCSDGGPCQNAGECAAARPAEEGAFRCNCSEGWSGEFCEQPRNSCLGAAGQHCANGGICVWQQTGANDYVPGCACAPGYVGERCQIGGGLVERCEADKECGENGQCRVQMGSDGTAMVYCECAQGHFGEFCESREHPCSSALPSAPSCLNGGICTVSEGNASEAMCRCSTGWAGERCQRAETAEGNCPRCRNGATCQRGHCICPEGFGGDSCEMELDPCTKPPHGDPGICGRGFCRASLASGYNAAYSCDCLEGWSGPSCMASVDGCAGSSCANGAECVPRMGTNQFWCACRTGFTGPNCEETVDYCDLEGLCANGGKCKRQGEGNGYECECRGDFSGPNCEQRTDPCEPNPCRNGGTCSPRGGRQFECECAPGWTSPGENCTLKTDACEQEPDYCNGGQCRLLPDSNLPHCLCPSDSTGVRCESKKPVHYNLHFAAPVVRSPLLQRIRSPPFPCSSLASQFSLCLWVRLGDTNHSNESVFALLGETDGQNISSPTVVLDTFGARIIDNGEKGRMHFAADRSEIGHQTWHHVCVSRSECPAAHFGLFLNGKAVDRLNVSGMGLTEGRCAIVLGERPSQGAFVAGQFEGELSQVELYSGAVTSEQISQMAFHCSDWTIQPERPTLVSWTQFSTVDAFNTAQVAVVPGICANGDCQPGAAGDDCSETRSAKSPPQLVACPQSQFVTAPDRRQRLVHVHWNDSLEGMFRPSQSPIVRFESNFRAGQAFGWGQSRVVYLAEDANGNWAKCEFDVVVAPSHCGSPFAPDLYNNLVLRELPPEEAEQAQEVALLQCASPDLVSNAPSRPQFYTCDRLGQWNRWAQFGRPLALPSCTPVENAQQEVLGDVHFSGGCAKAEENKRKVVDCIMDASDKMGGFCELARCEGQLNVRTECLSAGSDSGGGTEEQLTIIRRRREVAEGNRTLRATFDLDVNKTKRAVAPVIRDAMEERFGSGFVGESTRLSCSDSHPQLHIQREDGARLAGSVAMAADPPLVRCATCAPGETWVKDERQAATTTKAESIVNSDASGACVKCAADTYKPDAGIQACTACPEGRITGGEQGCMSEIDCYLNCPPGSVYDSAVDACRPCPRGQFIPYAGRLQCMACPSGSTTEQEGSTDAAQCSVRCPAGQELVGGEQCRVCGKGDYRLGDDSMAACKHCRLGFTTRSEGAKSARECDRVFCPPGHHRRKGIAEDESGRSQEDTAFGSVCTPCPLGHYQANYGSAACERCPAGWLTRGEGARSVQECNRPWDGSCRPDEPQPCPEGMECVQIKGAVFHCSTLPPEREETDEGVFLAWRRLWIPLILAICSVISLSVLAATVVSNRRKWVLWLHRHYPAVLCCKKMTVDELEENNYARNDTRRAPPMNGERRNGLGTLANPNPVRAEGDMQSDSEDGSALRKEGSQPTKVQSAEPKKRALSESNSEKVEDPLGEIRSGLMEVLSADEAAAAQKLPDSFDFEAGRKDSPRGKRRPQLTVETQFHREDYGVPRHCSSSASPPPRKVQPSLPIPITTRFRNDQWFLGSARATDAIGMRVIGLEGDGSGEEWTGRGAALRRPARNTKIDSNEVPSSANEHSGNEGVVGLRLAQLEENSAGLSAFNGGQLRSSLTARSRLAPPKKMEKAAPSYDDDDDAFFS